MSEPDSPAAISIPFKTLPTNLLIFGHPRSQLRIQLYRSFRRPRLWHRNGIERPWALLFDVDEYKVQLIFTDVRHSYPTNPGDYVRLWQFHMWSREDFAEALVKMTALARDELWSREQRTAILETVSEVRRLAQQLHGLPGWRRSLARLRQFLPFESKPNIVFGDPQGAMTMGQYTDWLHRPLNWVI